MCQICGRRLEFPPERSGGWAVCAHCGQSTRLKPAPPELWEAAPPDHPPQAMAACAPPATDEAAEADATLRRLRRSYLTLLVVAVILLGVLIGGVWVAEWLRAQAHHP